MSRRANILCTITDYKGDLWDIREERPTIHGWPIMFGWPSNLTRGVGAGGPRVMIDKNLKQYLDDFRFDPGLINLPIGATVIKRLRRMLGYHRYRDRTLWWTARREDLLTMVLSKFCEKHNCCIGAASQMRGKYRNEKQ